MIPAAGVHFRRFMLTNSIYADDIGIKTSCAADLQAFIDALAVRHAILHMTGQWQRHM